MAEPAADAGGSAVPPRAAYVQQAVEGRAARVELLRAPAGLGAVPARAYGWSHNSNGVYAACPGRQARA